MSEVGEIGCLEVSSSNEILCVSESSNEVIFKKKTKKRKRFTTRSGPAAENANNNDLENWVVTPANSSGWFQIYNPASKKFLTSSKKSVKLEEKANLEKSKDKQLVEVKKVFIWCPYIEEFVTYIAHERDYKDQDLQVDLGLGTILILCQHSLGLFLTHPLTLSHHK